MLGLPAIIISRFAYKTPFEMFQNFIFYPPTGSRRRVGDFRGEGQVWSAGGKSPTIGANTSRAGDDVGVKWITPRHLMVVGRQSSSRPESVLHKKALATMVTPTTLTLVNLNSCPNRYSHGSASGLLNRTHLWSNVTDWPHTAVEHFLLRVP